MREKQNAANSRGRHYSNLVKLGGLTLLLSLQMAITQVGAENTYVSNTANKRWVGPNPSVSYDTEEEYENVKGIKEKYRMLWELYEGSIALVQMVVVWKEITEQDETGDAIKPDLQLVRTSGGARTKQTFRVRRLWQMASTKLAYDDVNEQGEEQAKNDFANMEYINKHPVNEQEWFSGDVVPFERCAYIVNMNSDGTTGQYVFSRLTTAVRWDPVLKYKKVVTQEDHTSQVYTAALDSDEDRSDIPDYYVEMGWWPQMGSFFYFNRGQIFLKHDDQADTIDYCTCPPDAFDAETMTASNRCEQTVNRCETAFMIDPCARSTPLFSSATTTMKRSRVVVGNTSLNNHAITWDVAIDSVFVIFEEQPNIIFRVAGTAYDNLLSSTLYTHAGTPTSPLTMAFQSPSVPTVGGSSITSLCSMDFYGLFLGVQDQQKVIRLEFNMDDDSASQDPANIQSVGDVQTIDSLNYYEMDDDQHPFGSLSGGETFRLLQTKGYFGRHRPCYMVRSDAPCQLNRLTTQITTFFPTEPTDCLGTTGTKIDLTTLSWSEGVVKQGAQLLRFHLFSSMPGDENTAHNIALADLDYENIKAFVYDIRLKQEWNQFALTTSGNGQVDEALGEECDPLNYPPIDLTYDGNEGGNFLAQAYPNADTKVDGTTVEFSANNRVSWIPADTITDLAGNTDRSEFIAEGYYTCSSASFLQAYSSCGDGVPSNGPPEVNSNNAALAKNQRNGSLVREVCDDGNQIDGDGCSADCMTVEDGYECLKWGEQCTKKCGNGHVEGFLTPKVDSDGNIVQTTPGVDDMVFEYEKNDAGTADREECDMGKWNSPNNLGSNDWSGEDSDGNFIASTSVDTSYPAYDDIYRYVCSNDCKLIQKQYTDDPTTYPQKSKYHKWTCTIDIDNPISWNSQTVTVATKENTGYLNDIQHVANNTREIYEQKCTYECGNRGPLYKPGTDSDYWETCDIGDWAFLGMNSEDGYNGPTTKSSAETDYSDNAMSVVSSADVQQYWDDGNWNPKINSSLMALGCTQDCRAVFTDPTTYDTGHIELRGAQATAQGTQAHHFLFDDTTFSIIGTDRCGDGIMDGAISYTNSTASMTVNLQSNLPTDTYYDGRCATNDPTYACTIVGKITITNYIPYWSYEYSNRILTEECDNGSNNYDIDPNDSTKKLYHGCDRLCKVMPGWTCYHYYHHMVGSEFPYFTSICDEDDPEYTQIDTDRAVTDPITAEALGTPPSRRRRLSPADFDSHGRILHDMPRRTYLFRLPYNTHEMRVGKSTLKWEPKHGLNGQIRIIESKDCSTCFGFMFAYQMDSATGEDYWYYNVADTTGQVGTNYVDMTANSNAMKGKQRNTFGGYMVVNKDSKHIEIWGYDTAASGTLTLYKTTTFEPSVQYLGNHEYYWFPNKELLMAKLSDGGSFRLFRLASNFRDIAASDSGVKTSWQFDSGEFRLFNVPGRTMVPPVFWKRWAYFYLSNVDETQTSWLIAYLWNDLTNEFEKKCEKSDMEAETTNTSTYHKYSMVSVGEDGIIFKKNGSTSFKRYLCTDDGTGTGQTFSDGTVTIDNTLVALSGPQEDVSTTAIDNSVLTLVQAREDPDNYVEGTQIPIYGIHGSGYIQKFTYTTDTLSTTFPSIVVPIDHQITVSPEHLDVGPTKIVVLSGTQCASDYETTRITNASVHYYHMDTGLWSTCVDLTDLQTTTPVNLKNFVPSRMDIEASYWTHNL